MVPRISYWYVPLPIALALSLHAEILRESERADVPRYWIFEEIVASSWPRYMYPLQKVDEHIRHNIPTDSKVHCFIVVRIWIGSYGYDHDLETLCNLNRNQCLWKIIMEVELRRSNWLGCLLIWLSKKCFSERSHVNLIEEILSLSIKSS